MSDIDDAHDNHDYLFFFVNSSMGFVLHINKIKCKCNQRVAVVFRHVMYSRVPVELECSL